MSQLDEIRKRLSKATPGPWVIHPEVDGVYADRRTVVWTDAPVEQFGARRIVSVGQTRQHREPVEANVEFIANARRDIPLLVSVVESILKLHQEEVLFTSAICSHCGTYWPCQTVETMKVLLED